MCSRSFKPAISLEATIVGEKIVVRRYDVSDMRGSEVQVCMSGLVFIVFVYAKRADFGHPSVGDFFGVVVTTVLHLSLPSKKYLAQCVRVHTSARGAAAGRVVHSSVLATNLF